MINKLLHLSGIFDAIGRITIVKSKNISGFYRYTPRIRLSTYRKEIVELFVDYFKYGCKSQYSRIRKPHYKYEISKIDDMENFINIMYDYIIIKKDTFDLFKIYLKECKWIQGKGEMPKNILEKRETLYLKLKELNSYEDEDNDKHE